MGKTRVQYVQCLPRMHKDLGSIPRTKNLSSKPVLAIRYLLSQTNEKERRDRESDRRREGRREKERKGEGGKKGWSEGRKKGMKEGRQLVGR